MASDKQQPDEPMPDVDPVEFARAMLGISPEDAAKVRERSNPTRKRAGEDDRGHDPADDDGAS